MTYKESLNYIHSLNRFGIKPGLERINALLKKLGNPEEKLKCIHIAGTNGKGSTSTALSNIMIAEGKKTGLFISPFVVNFRERIQINGEYIKEKDLANLTYEISKIVPEVEKEVEDNITEFEFITALMFSYFKEQNCDVVILEVGLGGRLDSTNVIEKPLASVITQIALDHIAVLGDTIEKIALEKCGIIKENRPVITSSNQNPMALPVIEKTAEDKNSPLKIANISLAENVKIAPYGSEFTYKGMNITVNLAGRHQIENMTAAAETALTLGVSKTAIVRGIANTKFPARLEILSRSPLVILDGAHNENGADVLANYLDEHKLTPVTLMGMMADKNCEAVVEKIASRSKAVFTVKVEGNPRTETAENLSQIAGKYCVNSFTAENYNSALSLAFQRCQKTNLPLLICGSLYLASDIRDMAINYLKK
ncbi:MAG: folylpolyglutamate synthase/dihydrofolate synthase family protein [Acutalibacteraceae bacterium]|nr:folylpolyglutamate synthase/dihydrofolate synthase family protein [Acutalibacteraceae bacterium]